MCMKYVNTTATCYKSVVIENEKIASFNAPFMSIKSIENESGVFLDDFTVVTQIDFLGTNNPKHKADNPLEQKKTIDFIVRLTKCVKEPSKRVAYDLDNFSIDLADMDEKQQVDLACFGFLNYTRITNVKGLDLPGGTGKYVIKILVKNAEDKEYSIQSMSKLIIL